MGDEHNAAVGCKIEEKPAELDIDVRMMGLRTETLRTAVRRSVVGCCGSRGIENYASIQEPRGEEGREWT